MNDTRKSGNIIKAHEAMNTGSFLVDLADDGCDEPTVEFQREGETVVGVRFVCKCGRTSELKFDYAQE